jgi:hypothetical protein
LIQNNQAFLRTFLQKKKGKHSSGSDSDWEKLAEDVDKYSSMSGDVDFALDNSSDADNGNDDDDDRLRDANGLEDDKSINLELD